MEPMTTRQQAARANRTMFLWVAGASVIVGFSIVLSIFLVQKIWFTGRVISEKAKTQSVLEKDIAAIPGLRDSIRVLNTNDSLKAVRLNDNDLPIQSVLDALPADANDTALGASLATKIIGEVPGVTLESITVDPASATSVDGVPATADGLNTMNFTVSVSVPVSKTEALRQVLLRSEKSIRVFEFTGMTVDTEGSKQVMTLQGHAYYAPATSLELKEKVVR